MGELGPRLVIAGTHSGVGKTTVATGLMAAWRSRGVRVTAAKVGPDYIDPGYHALATGRPGRNLDAWMGGAAAVPALAGRAARDGELLVIEGVMGLFDGAADGTPSSTAVVASLLDAPVILVVDAASMSSSVAALVHGFATWDPAVTVAGVILNRVGSASHEIMLRAALEPVGVPVVGALHRNDALAWRDRHLGLIPVVEHPGAVAAALHRLTVALEAGCDLDTIHRIAREAPRRVVSEPALPQAVGGSPRIAMAAGAAFSFAYEDNREALAAAGAEIVPFDPLHDPALPDACAALVVGGGFPEVYAQGLAENRPLLADLAARVDAGLVVWAECGGLLWLAQELDGHRMAGVIQATASMTEQLTLGYCSGTTTAASPLGPAGTNLRGHEFHYSATDPPGAALDLEGRLGWRRSGFTTPRLLASYLHVHLGAAPELAAAFVRTAANAVSATRPLR